MNRFDDYLLVQWILCNLNTNSIPAAQIWSVESENMMKDPISDGCLRPGATLVIVIILPLLSLPSSHIMISSHSHQQMAGQTTWIETIRETAEKCPYCELLLKLQRSIDCPRWILLLYNVYRTWHSWQFIITKLDQTTELF